MLHAAAGQALLRRAASSDAAVAMVPVGLLLLVGVWQGQLPSPGHHHRWARACACALLWPLTALLPPRCENGSGGCSALPAPLPAAAAAAAVYAAYSLMHQAPKQVQLVLVGHI
jgi:hypothetical protein